MPAALHCQRGAASPASQGAAGHGALLRRVGFEHACELALPRCPEREQKPTVATPWAMSKGSDAA